MPIRCLTFAPVRSSSQVEIAVKDSDDQKPDKHHTDQPGPLHSSLSLSLPLALDSRFWFSLTKHSWGPKVLNSSGVSSSRGRLQPIYRLTPTTQSSGPSHSVSLSLSLSLSLSVWHRHTFAHTRLLFSEWVWSCDSGQPLRSHLEVIRIQGAAPAVATGSP